MADNEERPPESTSSQLSKSSAPPLPRPSITLPPRASFEALFNGGGAAAAGGPGSVDFSPGPMTLVSSFFSDADADNCKSFSQLLAGAMASPASTSAAPSLPLLDEPAAGDGGADEADFRFKQNRPSELAVAQSSMFTAGLPDSPGLFSPGQGEFGMSHQLALAQVTAQAAQTNSNSYIQTEYLSSLSAPLTQLQAFSTNATTQQEVPPLIPDSSLAEKESSDVSHQDLKSQPSSFNADKPNDDGYNWRKYGQKNVKGSEFPRSYYKCTHLNCSVKKKVERSLDGQVTEIIYKGQHNHQRPQSNKRGKDAGNSNGNSSTQGNHDLVSQIQSGYYNKSAEGTNSYSISRKDRDSSQATHEHLSGTSDSEEVGDAEEKDEDEPEPKRRNTEVRHSEPASSHRTVTEPRIIVQTTSEVDLLDDGYRWRKYGQKVVKGNPNPRSYYKCTTTGCNVRKHIERASTDPKAVITTYEGKHNHDVPASKTSSHNTAANSSASNQRLQNTRAQNHGLSNATDLRNNTRQPITRLRLKEEQIT